MQGIVSVHPALGNPDQQGVCILFDLGTSGYVAILISPPSGDPKMAEVMFPF